MLLLKICNKISRNLKKGQNKKVKQYNTLKLFNYKNGNKPI